MAKRRKNKEELTAKMHSEFEVSEDQDRKHVAMTALEVIESGLMTEGEAIKAYGLDKLDLDWARNNVDDL